MFEKMGDMLGNLSGGGLLLIFGIIAMIGMGWFLYRLAKVYLRKISGEVAEKQKELYLPAISSKKNKKKVDSKDKDAIVGEGDFRCYIFRDGFLEPSLIKRPIGNVFMADTSMPVSGACYLVRETESGDIEPYDPREVPFNSKRSPQWAYFATHWSLVPAVFASVKNWWQMAPAWVTVLSGVAAVIVIMVVLG